MAISFVGASTFVSGTTSPQTATLPSGVAAGDFLLCLVSSREDSPTPVHGVSGYTQTGSTAFLDLGTTGISLSCWYKVAGPAESGPSVTCTTPSRLSCHTLAFRGVDLASPFDGTTAQGTNAAAATYTPPNITTGTDGAWVVSNVSTADDNALNLSAANGYTERASGADYDNTNVAHGSASKQISGTGSQSLPTWNESVNGNDAWAYVTVALKPGPRITDTGAADAIVSLPQPVKAAGPVRPFLRVLLPVALIFAEPSNDIAVVVQAHVGGPAVATGSRNASTVVGGWTAAAPSAIAAGSRAAAMLGAATTTTTIAATGTRGVAAQAPTGGTASAAAAASRAVVAHAPAGADADATMQSEVDVAVEHVLGPVGATTTIAAGPAPAAAVRADTGAHTSSSAAPSPNVTVPAAGGGNAITSSSVDRTPVVPATTGGGGSGAGSGDRSGVVQALAAAGATAQATPTLQAIIQAAVGAAAQATASTSTDVDVVHVLGSVGATTTVVATVTRTGAVKVDVGAHVQAGWFQSISDSGDQAEVFRLPVKVIRRGPVPREITVPVQVSLIFPAPVYEVSVVVVATVGGSATTSASGARAAVVPVSATGGASDVEATVSFTDVYVSAVLGMAGIDSTIVAEVLIYEVEVGSAPVSAGLIATIDARAERSIISHIEPGLHGQASNFGAAWVFRPPTEERILERMPHDPGNRMARDLSIGVRVGRTVYKLADGSYTMKWSERLDIVHTYHGGHIHEISDTEAGNLIAAGYGAYVTLEQ
jgi:hypothetical protein